MKNVLYSSFLYVFNSIQWRNSMSYHLQWTDQNCGFINFIFFFCFGVRLNFNVYFIQIMTERSYLITQNQHAIFTRNLNLKVVISFFSQYIFISLSKCLEYWTYYWCAFNRKEKCFWLLKKIRFYVISFLLSWEL